MDLGQKVAQSRGHVLIIAHPIPGMQIIFYSADKMQAHTSREKMICRKLALV